jgi:hypothetical protein
MKPSDLNNSTIQDKIVSEILDEYRDKKKPIPLNDLDIWSNVFKPTQFGRKFRQLVDDGTIKEVAYVCLKSQQNEIRYRPMYSWFCIAKICFKILHFR